MLVTFLSSQGNCRPLVGGATRQTHLPHFPGVHATGGQAGRHPPTHTGSARESVMAAEAHGVDESGGIPATLPVSQGAGFSLSASAAVPTVVANLVSRQTHAAIPVAVGTPVTIGRKPTCTIQVRSAHVSGEHCRVEAKEGAAGDHELFITDTRYVSSKVAMPMPPSAAADGASGVANGADIDTASPHAAAEMGPS